MSNDKSLVNDSKNNPRPVISNTNSQQQIISNLQAIELKQEIKQIEVVPNRNQPMKPAEIKPVRSLRSKPLNLPWQPNIISPAFTVVNRTRINFKPKGVLVLDVDETLLDYKESKIIQKEKIKKLIEKAIENGLLIVIATARPYEMERDGARWVSQVVEQVGSMYFNRIYFTANNSKLNVLNHLWLTYFQQDLNAKKKIALVDDQDGFLSPCYSEGFHAIKADKSGNYLFDIEDFIVSCSDKKNIGNKVQDDLPLFFKRKEYKPLPLYMPLDDTFDSQALMPKLI